MDSRIFHKISYGVYIISSKKGDRINAQTANALMQVTSEPQQIAIGINKGNLTHEFIQDSGAFAVSVLAQDCPLKLIGNFGFKSGREVDKCSGINHRLTESGCPVLLEHSLGYLSAKVANQLDVGTHTIFIGEVVEAELLRDAEPMTYAYYHQVKRGTTPKTAPTYIKPEKT